MSFQSDAIVHECVFDYPSDVVCVDGTTQRVGVGKFSMIRMGHLTVSLPQNIVPLSTTLADLALKWKWHERGFDEIWVVEHILGYSVPYRVMSAVGATTDVVDLCELVYGDKWYSASDWTLLALPRLVK